MTALVQGTARGKVLALQEPLSFWGGVSPETGQIVEPAHPQFGEYVTGVILGLPHGRGSSSAASVLAELLRAGLGPSGIIVEEPDSILVIGALVAEHLYGVQCPITMGPIPPNGAIVSLSDGFVTVEG